MTKLERMSKDIRNLAYNLGYEIHYRGGQYWAGSDIQLTYKVYNGAILTLDQKIPYAVSILKRIEEARNKKRSLKDRVKELVLHFNKTPYFPNNVFTEMRTPELDQLTILNWNGELTAFLYLIGQPKIELKDHHSKESLGVSLNAVIESYS